MIDAAGGLAEEQELFLFVGFAGHALERVAGRGDDVLDLRLVERFLGDDFRFVLAVGGRDLLHIKGLADGIVDMILAHAAHHAVYFQRCLNHRKQLPFLTIYPIGVSVS